MAAMVSAADPPPSRPGPADAGTDGSQALVTAALLAGFFEAGWSIQVLVGDADRATFEASRIARPQAQQHLQRMSTLAARLPEDVRERMPRVDWQAWIDLGAHLPPRDLRDRTLVWVAISAWLPPTGSELRRYRRLLPQLWRFRL